LAAELGLEPKALNSKFKKRASLGKREKSYSAGKSGGFFEDCNIKVTAQSGARRRPPGKPGHNCQEMEQLAVKTR
jgi:hypothetical protein